MSKIVTNVIRQGNNIQKNQMIISTMIQHTYLVGRYDPRLTDLDGAIVTMGCTLGSLDIVGEVVGNSDLVASDVEAAFFLMENLQRCFGSKRG